MAVHQSNYSKSRTLKQQKIQAELRMENDPVLRGAKGCGARVPTRARAHTHPGPVSDESCLVSAKSLWFQKHPFISYPLTVLYTFYRAWMTERLWEHPVSETPVNQILSRGSEILEGREIKYS